MHTFDISLENITKIEGAASLEVNVKDGKVEKVKFETVEYKRFFTNAMQGKQIAAIPQHLARICGTCSNAHIICAIEACENALGIKPSEQTMLLRVLALHGLMIRDHGLHLYLFSLPDLYNKDSFLDFDENDPDEHQLLHDGFEVKSAGNFLATLIAGRSVHGTYPTIGGFLHFPDKQGIEEAIKKLESARPAVLRLIEIFKNSPFHFDPVRGRPANPVRNEVSNGAESTATAATGRPASNGVDRKTNYMALVPEKSYGYISGKIITSTGESYGEDKFREHLERVVLPYSQASAYEYKGEGYMVGALARMNLAKNLLHPNTKSSAKEALSIFPSTDIFHNNLAQAIEILHSIDESIEILKNNVFAPEPVIKAASREAR